MHQIDNIQNMFSDAKKMVSHFVETYQTLMEKYYQQCMLEVDTKLSEADTTYIQIIHDNRETFMNKCKPSYYKNEQNKNDQDEYILKRLEEIYMFQDKMKHLEVSFK